MLINNHRWNTGNLYENMNFAEEEKINVGYSYTDNVSRFHRYTFTKQKLIKDGFDSNKSSLEIMNERGYKRIWDFGNTKWIGLNNHNILFQINIFKHTGDIMAKFTENIIYGDVK